MTEVHEYKGSPCQARLFVLRSTRFSSEGFVVYVVDPTIGLPDIMSPEEPLNPRQLTRISKEGFLAEVAVTREEEEGWQGSWNPLMALDRWYRAVCGRQTAMPPPRKRRHVAAQEPIVAVKRHRDAREEVVDQIPDYPELKYYDDEDISAHSIITALRRQGIVSRTAILHIILASFGFHQEPAVKIRAGVEIWKHVRGRLEAIWSRLRDAIEERGPPPPPSPMQDLAFLTCVLEEFHPGDIRVVPFERPEAGFNFVPALLGLIRWTDVSFSAFLLACCEEFHRSSVFASGNVRSVAIHQTVAPGKFRKLAEIIIAGEKVTLFSDKRMVNFASCNFAFTQVISLERLEPPFEPDYHYLFAVETAPWWSLYNNTVWSEFIETLLSQLFRYPLHVIRNLRVGYHALDDIQRPAASIDADELRAALAL